MARHLDNNLRLAANVNVQRVLRRIADLLGPLALSVERVTGLCREPETVRLALDLVDHRVGREGVHDKVVLLGELQQILRLAHKAKEIRLHLARGELTETPQLRAVLIQVRLADPLAPLQVALIRAHGRRVRLAVGEEHLLARDIGCPGDLVGDLRGRHCVCML